MIWLIPTIITLLGAALLFFAGRAAFNNGVVELIMLVVGIAFVVCGILIFGLLLWLAG